MSDSEDYYKILGVEKTATLAEIKKAYRKLAMQYHPDRNPNNPEAAEQFKKAAEAYEVLGHEEKRRLYDQYGRSGLGGRAPHFDSFEDIFSAFSEIFSGGSLFEDFFGFSGGRQRRKGRSLRIDLAIDLEEVATGAEKTVTIRRLEHCEACKGTGCGEGTKPTTCTYCRGSGKIEQRQGFFVMRTACPRCRGTGQYIESPCSECEGYGRDEKSVTLGVKVPAGIDDGSRLRIVNQGEVGEQGSERGDLFVDVHVRPHSFFQRSGRDIYCEVPISYPSACLGGEIDVPTLNGSTEELQVPRGAQSGDILTVKGAGMSDPHGHGHGNLLVRVFIETPTKLTARQEELLHELAEIEHVNVTPKRKSFLEKIKNYFSE